MDKENTYTCKCGRQFARAYALNGHKRHCLAWLGEEQYNKYVLIDKAFFEGGARTDAEKSRSTLKRKEEALQLWVSEQHQCERCGKIMTKKFGVGRFCCQKCANIHFKLSEEERQKRQELIKNKKAEERARQKEIESCGLPNIGHMDFPKGYPNRKRRSYAELFWQTVLTNNNIAYDIEYKVLKNDKTPGCYKLDFYLKDYNVDLEIDGELHKRTIEKDTKRDAYLSSLGYKIYRIKWINPNTKDNKILVKSQVDNLLAYISSIEKHVEGSNPSEYINNVSLV